MAHKATPPAQSEQEAAAWYQWPFYTWVSPLLSRGAEAMSSEVALEENNLYNLPSFETPEVVSAGLQEKWKEELATENPSLARALRRAFWPRIAIGGCFRLLSDGSAFAAPFLLRLLIDWLNDDSEADWIGWVLVASLVLSNVIMSASLVNATHHTTTGFQQMATAAAVMTYNAAFDFKDAHGKTGPLIAAHSSDAFKLLELSLFIHGVWVSPLLVLGAVVALYFFIGPAGFIAVGLLVLSIPLQSFLMGLVYTFRGAQVKLMDVRVQKINEALQGIRICKFMNWELSFSQVVGSSREAEVVVLGKTYMARALANTVTNALQQIVLLVLFALTYVIDEDNITTAKVFPALSMINVIRIPLMFIPLSISKILETKISVERIQKILLEKSHIAYVDKLDAKSPHAITLDNVSVLGDNDQVLVDKASVRIPKKKLTIITGATASGKSLLVKAMLGEVPVGPGSAVAREGDVAYVPQDPWVMNATLKENILLGGVLDDARYLDTLNSCQLMDDLEQLPGSDQTDIGERGINLSGGQKQRIALARAVYNNQPVVLMDDPLSAVDPHVCKALFDEAICGPSLGKRTRVLVTHQTQFLPSADHIVFMKDCSVLFQGTYKDYIKFLKSIGEKPPADHGTHSPEPASPVKPHHRNDIPAPQQDDVLMSKEVNRVGDVQWSTYLWWVTLGGVPKMTITMLCSGLWTAGVVFFNLLLAYWAGGESLFGKNANGDQYIMWLGICVVFIVLALAARQFCHAFFSVQAAKNSHAAMMDNILRAPISFFDTTPLGRIMNRFTKDIDAMDTRIQEIVVMTLNIGFQLLGTIALVGIATVYLLPIFPVLGVIFYFLYKYYTQTLRGVKRIEGSARSPMIAMMNGCVNGLASIRGYNMVDQFIDEHMRRTRRAMTPSYCVRCCQRWLSMRTEALGSFVVLCTGVFAVVVKTTDGDSWAVGFTPSVSALAITYALATTNAVTFLTRTMADLESEMSSAERVKEYSDAIPQERDVQYSSEPGETPAPDAAWPKDGALSFRDVQLRYRDGLPLVLKGISFEVPTGSKVGIVGRTGSGKSTLMLALFRMVELAGGSILFSGKDVAELSLTDLRQQITIIPQDPLLFEGTIRTNLDPFNELDDAAVWGAVDRVGLRDRLTDFITAGPCGLDAPVAEKGGNFSVGQRQLLCLARALLKRSKVLLLDEATASVDFESDALIQRTIRTEFAACTVLTIAHRLATVADSDKMLVLGAGSVVEYGAPRELLKTKGSQFRQMAEQLGEKQFANIMRLTK